MLQATEEPLHIRPVFGKEHELSKDCWCEPVCINTIRVINGDDVMLIYVHKVLH